MRGMTLSVLVMNSRNNDSRRVKFARLPVSMGRHDYNSLQLVDPGVSRFHAVIEWTDAKVVVCDLGSVNGTFYQGLPLPPCEPRIIDDEDFSIAVGPFHLAISRHVTAPAADPDTTRVIDPSELRWLRRPDDGVTVIRRRFGR
jgi:hypothetical protein